MIETVQGLQSGKAKSMRTDVDAVTRMKKYLANLGRTRRRKFPAIDKVLAHSQYLLPNP